MAIKYTDKIKQAAKFALKAHSAINQLRSYSDLPYFVHPLEVATIVSTVTQDEDIIIAALLHDVIEDVYPKNSNYSVDKIRELFGESVALYVQDLTDIYTTENYPLFNRKQRKELEANRLKLICPESKIIKLADIISNTLEIVLNDPKFGKVYIKEMEFLLNFLYDEKSLENINLFIRANQEISLAKSKLNEKTTKFTV